jgi:hypothetical protein
MKPEQIKADRLTLVKIAANLLTERLSGYGDDWPQTMPKAALRAIDRHNERQRLWALEIKRVCDNLRPLCNPETPPCPAVNLPDGWPWDSSTRFLMAAILRILAADTRVQGPAQSLARWLEQSSPTEEGSDVCAVDHTREL